MIVPKKKDTEEVKTSEGTVETTSTESTPYMTAEDLWIQQQVEANPMYEAYMAVRTILETIKEDPDDDTSPNFFKTIKLRTGQVARVKHNEYNKQYGLVFPAVFIHFVDIYYNQGAAGIGEGRGTMRIHYVLNRLNNEDDGLDCEGEGLKLFKRIVAAIEAQKSNYPALQYRFQLQYWDMPETFDDAVQPFWIDYQIYFQDFTTYAYQNYVNVFVTAPPFTQPKDQNEIARDPNEPDQYEAPTFDESSSIKDTFE